MIGCPRRNRRRPATTTVEAHLSPLQRRLLGAVVGLGLALRANAGFLGLFRIAEATERFRLPPSTVPAFYQAMVLGHTVLGLVTAALTVYFVAWHLASLWKRRHASAVASGSGLLVAMLVLTVTGLFFVTAANSREHRWAFFTHVGLAVALPVAYVLHRMTAAWLPTWTRVRAGLLGAAAAVAVRRGDLRRGRSESPGAGRDRHGGRWRAPAAGVRADGIVLPEPERDGAHDRPGRGDDHRAHGGPLALELPGGVHGGRSGPRGHAPRGIGQPPGRLSVHPGPPRTLVDTARAGYVAALDVT